MLNLATTPKPIATLIHLSDLHFSDCITADERLSTAFLATLPKGQGLCGHSYQAARALATRVAEVLTDRIGQSVPVSVVVTGHLTSSGGEREFTTAATFLRSRHSLGGEIFCGLNLAGCETELFLVPGNHDIWRRFWPQDLGAYKRHFPGTFPTVLKIPTSSGPVFVYGVDSTQNSILRSCLARGRVDDAEFGQLLSLMRENRSETAIQIVCLHHPLCDRLGELVEPENQLERRQLIARRLADAGADLVLSGHIHDYFVPEDRQDVPLQAIAGTATQQFHTRSFFVLDVYPTVMDLIVFGCNDLMHFTVVEEYLLYFARKRHKGGGQNIVPMPVRGFGG